MKVICFECAEIFTVDNEDSKLACPLCKFTNEPSKYLSLFKFAKNAVEFGFNYREVYEEELKEEGEINTRYHCD